DLKELLERLDIEQIIVTGMKTEYCIDTTIRAASEIGYKIMVASDAHTTFDSIHLSAQYVIDHHNQIFRNAFAKVNTTEELIS
ncbi:isochorismatase family protein, partial [Acinetobacter baumannii]